MVLLSFHITGVAMNKKMFGRLAVLAIALLNGCDDDSSSGKAICAAGEHKCLDAFTAVKCTDAGIWEQENCAYGCYMAAGECMYPDDKCHLGETRCKDGVYSVCENDTWKDETCKFGCDQTGCKAETKCKDGSLQCAADGLTLMVCRNDDWTEQEKCSNGCDVDALECKPLCREGTVRCDGEDGKIGRNVVICHDEQWEEHETCDYKCVGGACSSACDMDGDHLCKGDDLMVCHENWEFEQTCALGCFDNRCKECATVDEQSCADAGNLRVCQSDYTLQTQPCPLGCLNDKCKQCTEIGRLSCSDAGNVQTCQSDFMLAETTVCDHGCKDAVCLECQEAADCAVVPGWKSGQCTNNTCVASACKGDYILQGSVCTLEIPFAGNVFVTEMENNSDIIEHAADILWDYPDLPTNFVSWKNPKETLSFFFAPKKTGKMTVFVEACLYRGSTEGKLSFTYQGESHEITVDSTSTKVYEVGTWDVKEPGYVKIDVRATSITPANSEFARFGNFYIGGDVASQMPACTPKAIINDAYWNRRGPSVHMGYTMPDEDVEWFYNEVVVPDGSDIINSYFMLTGFSEGYMGIQANSATERKVLFSVWSAYSTDDPNQIPAEYQVTTLRKGDGVEPQPFGNEGSGLQSFYDYPWVTEKTYRTLVHIKPTGDGATDYTGYFGDEKGNWHLVASFRRPKTSTWYKGAHSFLENYNPASSIYPREVHFTNQWMRTKSGRWIEVTEAKLTADTAGTRGYRIDREGSSSGSMFILKNCGFFVGSTNPGDMFSRQKSGNPAPEIDFDMLERL